VITLGIILILVGWLVGLSILYTLGVVLLLLGVVLWALGASGRAVGGRTHYW